MNNELIDSVLDAIGSTREENGARVARRNLEETYNYPSLKASLPYRYYDDVNELYINEGSIGFILEAAPLPGANHQIVQSLDDMLRKKLPRESPISVFLVASKCVGRRIAEGVSPDMWKGHLAPMLNKITRAYWEKSALDGISNNRNYPLYLRNYRVFLVYAKPIRRKLRPHMLDEIKQLRNTLRVSLEAARLQTRNASVNDFLSQIRELINYRSGQVMPSDDSWNTDEELNRQIVDPGIDLEVHPSYLRLELPPDPLSPRRLADSSKERSVCRVINMELSKRPSSKVALWQTVDNLQNLRFPDLGIPCPFVMSWCVEVDDQVKSQNEAFRKDMDLQKKAHSAYATLFPGIKRAAQEWQDMRQGLFDNSISLGRMWYNLTLFTPDSDQESQACELAAINVFRKNSMELNNVKFQQMRNWLASFPFVLQEGMWEDIKKTGSALRCRSFNAVNIMPVVAERQLSPSGMPLPTYRNQIAFLDMFSEDNGGTNFNIAVTGTSGAGKTFFVQGVLRDVFNTGGYAWVIDMGDSYKNYCKQAGGVYLDGADLRFNPFASVRNINESAEGIVRLLAVLASPSGDLDEVCEAILQRAVMSAWEQRRNKARIDEVHAYLTSQAVMDENADKPTILSRVAELALLLERYCTWGADGEYFNAEHPTLNDETKFAVLEMLSLENKPKLLSAILFSLILSIQEKMYHTPRDLKKVAIIDEAWRLLSGSNPHAAKFIETGYRTVRRHRGAFITITQGIKDFTSSREAEAAWNNSATKITLLQDAKAFKSYLADNPDQFTEMEQEVIRYFQKAKDTGFSSLLISSGEQSSFHRMFVDPVTRAMFSSRGVDFEFMQEAQKAGATSEEAAYLLAKREFEDELQALEEWVALSEPEAKAA